MAHAVRRRKNHRNSLTKDPLLVSINKKVQEKKNNKSNNGGFSRYQKVNLHTEVVMRKEKLTPEKVEAIKRARANLTAGDVDFLTQLFHTGDSDHKGLMVRSELHIALQHLDIRPTNQELDDLLAFADADGSLAIDLDEWLMLVGLLVQPPYDGDELTTAFETLWKTNESGTISTSDFRTEMENVLTLSLNRADLAHLPKLLQEMIDEFDPEKTGSISHKKCIEKLMIPYASL